MRTLLALFIFGAIIGNLYNSFHAFSGTIPVTPTHINPLLDWSSYLLFGFAGVAIGLATMICDKFFRKNPPSATWPNAIGAGLFLGIFYFISACMFLSNTIILIALIFGFILAWFIYDRSPYTLFTALIVAIAGTAAEITMVNQGVYCYSRPQLMGVAYWLPFLYGLASIATGQIARALNSKK